MSAASSSPLRTLAFGDLEAGIWGFVWGDAEPRLALGTLPASTALGGVPARLGGSRPDEEWTVAADRVELVVSPETEAAGAPAIAGFDQLCRVRGEAVIDGSEREFNLPGRRGERSELDLGRFDAVRDVCAWFAPGDGVILSSLRPRGAKGHDRDVVAAAVFEPGGIRPVADPRLSTTYAADGHPIKVGLELWIELEDSDEQYPRRVAGEMLGPSAAWSGPAVNLEAYLVGCRSRGEEGIGVYAIVSS